MPTRHFRRAVTILGAVIAALMFFVGGAALRLLMGPISLGPFAGAIEDSLNRSVSGLVVRFDQAVLEWSRDDNKINLIILGTKVFDLNGHIVAQAPKADLDFDAASLITGTFALKRFALMDVQLTAVHTAAGELKLGFGPGDGNADLLKIIRESLKDSADEGGSLETFSIRDARVAFRDDPTGLFVVSPNVSFTLNDTGKQFDASLDAGVEISGAPAQISAHAVLREDGTLQQGTVELHGVNLASLAANSARFEALKPYALKVDVASSFAAADGQITAANFHVHGAGAIAAAILKTNLQIDTFDAAGRYEGAGGDLVLDAATLSGPNAAMKAKGDVRLSWKDGQVASAAGTMTVEDIRLKAPALFQASLVLKSVSVKAAYDGTQRKLTWQNLAVQGENLSAQLSGAVVFAQNSSPAIAVNGTLAELPVRDALRYWPIVVGAGARLWIDENVSQGTMGPLEVSADIAAGALDKGVLPEEALSVGFPFDGVTAQYVKGLTPLTRVHGEGRLTGDTFQATIASAAIGPVAVSQGDANVPQLHLPGPIGRLKAHVEGAVPDVLALIDQPPLGYPTRFNVKPATTSGHAALDLSFLVPMRHDLKVEEIDIGIGGRVTDLAMPLDTKRTLDHGNATLAIDGKHLSADGTASLSGVPVTFKWTEDFAPTLVSTRVSVQGRMDDGARAALGLPGPEWLTGPLGMNVLLTGRHFHFDDANLHADLAGASVDLPVINFTKRPGTPGNASAMLHFGDKGALMLSEIAVTGPGMDVRGAMSLDADGTLVSAALPVVKLGQNADFALNVEQQSQNRIWHLRGRSLDATHLFGDEGRARAAPPAKDDFFDRPISIDARLDRVLFRDDLTFHNVVLTFGFGANHRLANFTVDAVTPAMGHMVGRMTETNGVRNLAIQSDTAADVVHALTGLSSLRNGKLDVNVNFPVEGARPAAKAPEADYSGTIAMTDFTVVDQPFLARLLSSGSLDGPLRLLSGQGIAFTKFEAPFSARGKLATLHDGRASGPAIGLSFQGVVDRGKNTLDLNGSLVPVYGLNSVLGALPVVGDLLVSKPGEGIIGLTYNVKGNLEEPVVSVNPLSVLTPGIFRRIFEFTTAKEAPESTLPPASAPSTPAAPPDTGAETPLAPASE